MPCPQAPNSRGVLPLRRYIEETLRRSRTSYSTLQVALYYLILIKPHVNRVDLVADQSADAVARRAMQCGRRMFLSALILASKYLQDRNYSAKAWSKMSGLKTTEINSNERLFLDAVNWKLHIPEGTFKRWTEIVLRFTASPSALPSSGVPVSDSKALWARVIPLLTSELDDPRIMTLPLTGPLPPFAVSPTGFLTPKSTPTPPPTLVASPMPTTPRDNTPSPATICPRFLEPKPDLLPPTPGLVRMGPLPTPQMTPSSIASSTPAASTCSSRRPSMSMAIAQAQNNMFNRMTLDRLANAALTQRSASLRFPSVAPSAASCSSPESMISDRTRSSRSSSISSTSTMLTSAPRCASSARSATGQFCGVEVINLETTPTKTGTADHPIILDSPEMFCLKGNASAISQMNPVTCINPRDTKKRNRANYLETAADEQLQADVRALLLQSDAVEVLSDSRQAPTRVSPCALRKAMASLGNACPFSGVRSAQPPPTLRRTETVRLPLMQDNGRKRVCSSVERSEPGADNAVPDIFMEVADSVWQGVA
ncbi:hypothetical protein K461DRAFT_274546 [Myriangium duriaei CBS 260.36]|uniref:Cyclin N-terminal domain-containing protein n=1 Tax=Myriangium duriaei CBS 260.36 TaxID=1168546 RepID=A0A9P4MJP9_9PEZI|nr:hypothetical protein K461DRAFT_274546 [Myriangium duriaei CBS 260.36]